MKLKFTKMHGAGNDFIVVDAIHQQVDLSAEQWRKLADRRFGIGADQILVVERPTGEGIDFRYRIFNNDGGEVEQCGNGARAFARFVSDKGLSQERSIRVETMKGVIAPRLEDDGSVTVDMGAPRLAPSEVPFDSAGIDGRAEGEDTTWPLPVDGKTVFVSVVSMGNPHAVQVVDDVDTAPVDTMGPAIETHARFPQKVNAGFMQVLDRHHVKLRVFERGAGEPLCFWELAAAEHDRHAQLAMGLRCARMGIDGRRVAGGGGAANFKKAIRWLTLAGEQGLPEAWYALSRIYIKPEFSQRNVADAQRYLERAAEMGYADAQLECGNNAWRARRENENNDVRAAYWLQKAAAQGLEAAAALLRKIAPRLSAPAYVETGRLFASVREASQRGGAPAHPLLAARLELAALFNLSRAEALLLDVPASDQGHCLVIDIRASYGRSKRRLVLVETAQERHALDRIGRLFEQIDCGPSGPEGNYRQRLYRLRTLLGAHGKGEDEEAAPDEIGLAA